MDLVSPTIPIEFILWLTLDPLFNLVINSLKDHRLLVRLLEGDVGGGSKIK